MKGQFDEFQSVIRRHEATITSKQRQIADLEVQLAADSKAQQASEQAKSALQVKIDGLTASLADREKERQIAASARQKLEKELDDLRKVMADKSTEDIRRREADKSREAEMTRLRDQVVAAEKAREEQQKAQTEFANTLRVQVEGLQGQHKSAEKELKTVKSALKDKEAELSQLRGDMEELEGTIRASQKALQNVREQMESVETKLKMTAKARDVSDASYLCLLADPQDFGSELQALQESHIVLEDAVLEIETEKTEWARRMEDTARQLMDESAKRHQLEQALHDSAAELAHHRNIAATAEREMAKAASHIKALEAEVALLRSRENKTIVEHVHVLESAKKVTDRQLFEQVKENSRLNTQMKSLETHRNRLAADLDDMTRERDMLRKARSKDARAARASLSPEDKDVSMLLEEEKRARKLADLRVAALERDLQDQRKQLSTATVSSANAQHAEQRLQKKQEEVWRLEAAHEGLLEENARLLSEMDSRRRTPSTPRIDTSNRAELLRGLQQSHDALGRDMSDQLRRLDAQPLTPSRRQNAPMSSVVASTPENGKRMRQLEMEINGLRNQLDDQRNEKEFLQSRIDELIGGPTPGRPKSSIDQAMFSHFRLKAKSLRTQLDQ